MAMCERISTAKPKVKICGPRDTVCCRKDPFEYTTTGVLGARRDTMLTNSLLQRDQLGKSLPRGYTCYPGQQFLYGTRNFRKDGGMPGAICNWQVGKPSKGPKVVMEKDFISLNKGASMTGAATNYEYSSFRAQHDWRKDEDADKTCSGKPFIMDPCHTYGKANRPSTPMNRILEHKYQDCWINRHIRKSDRCDYENEKLGGNRMPDVRMNRANALRTYQVPVEDKELWKMSRFVKNAQPHLNTFLKEKKKVEALEANRFDRVSRKGINGGGMTIKAFK